MIGLRVKAYHRAAPRRVGQRSGNLVLRGGSRRAVLECQTLAFGIKGEPEQRAVVAGWSSLLNSLTHPLQVVIRTRRLETSALPAPADHNQTLRDSYREARRDPHRRAASARSSLLRRRPVGCVEVAPTRGRKTVPRPARGLGYRVPPPTGPRTATPERSLVGRADAASDGPGSARSSPLLTTTTSSTLGADRSRGAH